jgi:hypothetical protein
MPGTRDRWGTTRFVDPTDVRHDMQFTAFWNLDSSLRDDLVEPGTKHEKEKMATKPGRRAFREELEAQLKMVKSANAAAVADENETLSKYLKEEKRVLEEKLALLPPPE